jgi:predicted secreted protein
LENGCYGFREALKAINTGDKDILHRDYKGQSTRLTSGEHLHYRTGTNPTTVFTFNIKCQNGVDGFTDKAAVLFDFIVNSIEP